MIHLPWFSVSRKTREEIWVEAFSQGFSKALDPESFSQIKEKLRSEAITETLNGLEEVIKKRLEDASYANLRPANELLAKKAQLLKSLSSEKDETKRIQFSHFIEALDWVINANSKSD